MYLSALAIALFLLGCVLVAYVGLIISGSTDIKRL